HFLTVNEKYDLPQYERELLIKTITEIHSYFENIVQENESLVTFLKHAIDDPDLRSEVRSYYTNIPGLDLSDEYKIVFKEKTKRKPKPK
ncbi:MAG: hypothetical protein QN651_09970, partial [Nitrososphaeraceae archaeon]|nr:hypothetical protein [Nitrososphaeraceae archaeon]